MAGETILLVEDQPELLEPVRCNLERDGYRVVTAADGALALDVFAAESPDLVILDVMLPRLDGLTVCRRIRSQSDVPVLILSAKGEESNVVAGLEVGGDDYVQKPFRMNELLARVRALLRRTERLGNGNGAAAPQQSSKSELLTAGAVSIDMGKCEVRVHGKPVALTPTEFRMMVELVRRAGQVISREELLTAVWSYDGYDDGLVNTHVKRLRARVEEDPADPKVVLTVRGFGYRLAV
jgi:DNA-binding response OmpR family regulator